MTLVENNRRTRMRILNISVAAVLGIWVGSAWAWSPFNSKSTLYRCSTYESAQVCGAGCEPLPTKIEFKVNTTNSAVIAVTHQDGKVSSSALDKCKVVDDGNWSCSTESRLGNVSSSFGRWNMTNGKLFWISAYSIRGNETTNYMCTK